MYVNKKTGCSCIQNKAKCRGRAHRSEKLGWTAGDMRQWPKQKKIDSKEGYIEIMDSYSLEIQNNVLDCSI